jgi:hypothetical protein
MGVDFSADPTAKCFFAPLRSQDDMESGRDRPGWMDRLMPVLRAGTGAPDA